MLPAKMVETIGWIGLIGLIPILAVTMGYRNFTSAQRKWGLILGFSLLIGSNVVIVGLWLLKAIW